MKFVWILCMITTLQAIALEGYTQSATVNIHMQNAKIESILKEIEKQSEYRFFYDAERINFSDVADVNWSSKKVNDALTELFRKKGIAYTLIEKQIVLFPIEEVNLTSLQGITVTGAVTDAAGEPIPGVNVVIKGTTIGVVTDFNGKFSINVPDKKTILVFSFLGYASQEIIVENQTVINVELKESVQEIEEVVVVGYGTQKRSEVTGSIASVKAKDVKNTPAKSISEAIGGRVAGVMVAKNSGAPGSEADIIIRGAASINGLGPLYIVDGVNMGTGFNFNIKDVESIEVLKDAGSSAIYGAKAAGGVILITTKRGKTSEKMNIELNARYGIRSAVSNVNLLNRDDFIKAKSSMGMDILNGKNASDLPDTDWMGELYSPAPEQEYNVSMTGGSEKYNYYLSGSYYREDGIRIDNRAQRYSIRANSDYKINKRLTIGESIYANMNTSNPVNDNNLAAGEGGPDIPFRSVPTMAVYDESNPLGGWGKSPGYFAGLNQVGKEMIYHYDDNNYSFRGHIYGDLDIIEGLNLRATLSGLFTGSTASAFTEAYDFGTVKNTTATMTSTGRTTQRLMSNVVLTYKKTIGKHGFKVMAGTEAIKYTGYKVTLTATDFPVTVAESINLSTNTNKTGSDTPEDSRTLSYFGRLNYSYIGKYLITANIRRDGSDKFGKNNRWGTFPSINGAWRFSEESFVKSNQKWLTNGKLRAGWGILGNDGIDQFLYEGAYSSYNKHSFGGAAVIQGWVNKKFPNEDIKWEEVNQIDLGIDLGFFKNRLNATFDWYKRNTKDMLYNITLPMTAGMGGYREMANTVPANLGEVQNIGSEISLAWQETRSGLYYNVGVNASFNTNKVIRIGKEGVTLASGSAGAGYSGKTTSRTEDGKAMGLFYGFRTNGLFQSEKEVADLNTIATQKAGKTAYYQKNNTGAGDLKYADQNGDGTITDADKVYIGNPWPKMVYGFNIDLGYKGFDLGLLFQGVAGVDLYNGVKAVSQHMYSDYNTTADIFGNSFFGSNNLTEQPRSGYFDANNIYVRDPNSNYSNVSSYSIENGSYMKLKNLSFGYTLPVELSKKLLIQRARVYIIAQNLFTITKYTGIDPEIAGDVRSRGIETIKRYIPTRLVSFGIDLTF